MKKLFTIALLALATTCLIGCNTENKESYSIYRFAVEFVNQQDVNISETVTAKTTVKAYYSEDTTNVWPITLTNFVGDKNIKYVLFDATTLSPSWRTPTVFWDLKSNDIFGDEKVHKIESKWEKSDNGVGRCVSFQFEGETYTPEFKNGYWTARVIIKR